MTYYMSTELDIPFTAALSVVEHALKGEGFGIISRIDVQQTLKNKIGVTFRPYTILGACNPSLAHEALLLEDKVGTMLPCNVVVQRRNDGKIEVAAVDPVASMQAINNPELAKSAAAVKQKLVRVVDELANLAGTIKAD